MRVTPFSVGRRWTCTREPGKRDQVFDFVILGPAKHDFSKNYKKTHLLCRLEVSEHGSSVDPETGKCCLQCCHNMEADYSRAHLKKYGVLVAADPLMDALKAGLAKR